MQKKMEYLEVRHMDETWDMNMHLNPIDGDTDDILKKHKGILMNNTDDFVQYINHSERARKLKVYD